MNSNPWNDQQIKLSPYHTKLNLALVMPTHNAVNPAHLVNATGCLLIWPFQIWVFPHPTLSIIDYDPRIGSLERRCIVLGSNADLPLSIEGDIHHWAKLSQQLTRTIGAFSTVSHKINRWPRSLYIMMIPTHWH